MFRRHHHEQLQRQRPRADDLRGTFETIGAGGENGDELIFDPATGELRSARDTGDPDRVPATQMAREGFFRHERDDVAALPSPLREADGTPAPPTHGEGEELVSTAKPGSSSRRQCRGDRRVPATQMAREGFFCYGSRAKKEGVAS